VVLVQTIPIARRETPRTAREILDRVNEISFNASLIKELVNVDFINRGLREGTLKADMLRETYLHAISGCGEFEKLSSSSKLNAEWAFFIHLRDLGRQATGEWLDTCFDRVGHASTVELETFWDDANSAVAPSVRSPDERPPGMSGGQAAE
jgi:NTE family protein